MSGKKSKQSTAQRGLELLVDYGMILYAVARIRYGRGGTPCTVRLDNQFSTPTEGEIEGVLKYAELLVKKAAYLRKWAKKAEKLLVEEKVEIIEK